jgi:hypothetical protein
MFNAKTTIDPIVVDADVIDNNSQTEKSNLETKEKYEPIKALGSLIRRHYPLIIVAAVAVTCHVIAKKVNEETDAIIAALAE